jgi:hypothetical protein
MRCVGTVAIILAWSAVSAGGVHAQEQVGTIQQPQTLAPSIDIPQAQGGQCGHAPSAADINSLARKERRMFPNPAGFDNNMASIRRDPCPRSRAAAYLVHLIGVNNWPVGR